MNKHKSLLVAQLTKSLPTYLSSEDEITKIEIAGENLFLLLDEYFTGKLLSHRVFASEEEMNRFLKAAQLDVHKSFEGEPEAGDDEIRVQELTDEGDGDGVAVLPMGETYNMCREHYDILYSITSTENMIDLDKEVHRYEKFLMTSFKIAPEGLKTELKDVFANLVDGIKKEMDDVFREDELPAREQTELATGAKGGEETVGSNIISLADRSKRR